MGVSLGVDALAAWEKGAIAGQVSYKELRDAQHKPLPLCTCLEECSIGLNSRFETGSSLCQVRD